jgi:heat shock protein HslJ
MSKGMLGTGAALVLSAVLGCGGNQAPVGPLPVGLVGVTWRLVTLGTTTPVLTGGGPDLTLQLSENRTNSGFSGCNRFRGTYMVNGDTLRFGPIINTQVGCAGNLTVERSYLATLGATNRFTVNADSLVLYQGPAPGLVFKH